jgi:hypothetical protein
MADTTNPGKKLVEIVIGKTTYKFLVGINEFNEYQDSMLPNHKVAPSENFLVACVQGGDEVKETLVELFEQGHALQLAGLLAGEFKPALEISVKK